MGLSVDTLKLGFLDDSITSKCVFQAVPLNLGNGGGGGGGTGGGGTGNGAGGPAF